MAQVDCDDPVVFGRLLSAAVKLAHADALAGRKQRTAKGIIGALAPRTYRNMHASACRRAYGVQYAATQRAVQQGEPKHS